MSTRRTFFRLMIASAAGLIISCVGCTSTPVASQFDQITVGKTSSSEIFAMMPEEGLLHNGDSISTYRKQGGSQELALITFNELDSLVKRKTYVHVSGQLALPPFTEQRLYLGFQSEIPAAVLDALYDNDTAKQTAILKYCQEAFIEDSRKFANDENTLTLTGMTRATLAYGVDRLSSRPREAGRLQQKEGFDFLHPVMGKCRLFLVPTAESLYRLELTATDWTDGVDTW
jgi:hypothetical protein